MIQASRNSLPSSDHPQALSSRKRIGIIGTGISGLTCAHVLHKHHDVEVFEARDRIGGHTHTVTVEMPDEVQQVDTGFIVFNEPNYPNFLKLMTQLGVAWQETDMSFSVRNDTSRIEWRGSNLNTLFAQRINLIRPAFLRMFKDICRFNKQGSELIEAGLSDEVTVQQFLDDNRYSDVFAENYLLPLSGALWSTPCTRIRAFPIRFILDFLNHHQMLQLTGQPIWRVIKGGSNSYLKPLTAGFKNQISTGMPAKSIRRREGKIEVAFDSETKIFDHVILACHSDQALKLLDAPTERETTFLKAFPYERNEVALHTDRSVLPKRERAWASWNYHVRKDDIDFDRASVTYQMNILQGIKSKHLFNVTLNDIENIREDKIIKAITYDHPLFTSERMAVQKQHDKLINHESISYCGAYWGFGFHEDGVKSALNVCRHFGLTLDDADQPLNRNLEMSAAPESKTEHPMEVN